MTRLDRGYVFLKSFWYPAILGAALAWWVQAFTTYVDGSQSVPRGWSLWFGLWFIVYQSIWYWHLLTEDKRPNDYNELSLATDFLDTIALLVGFASLGFAAGNYDKYSDWLTFAAATGLAVSASLANWRRVVPEKVGVRKWDHRISLVVAVVVPLAATLIHGLPNGPLWGWHKGPLIALYVIVVVYLAQPKLFGSLRSG